MNKAEYINSLKSSVCFFADGHYYTLGEERVKHTLTEILKKFNISPDYSFVKDSVLQKASQRGTALHELLEIFDNYTEIPPFINEEYIPLINSYISLKQDVLKSEFPVSYKTLLATKIDKLIFEDNDLIIADVKATSKTNLDSVKWQCSFGAFMLYHTTGIIATKGRLIWLNRKTNKCELQDFELIPFEKIEQFISLIEKDDFKDYREVLGISTELTVADDVLDEVCDLIEQEKAVKDKLKHLKTYLTELMRSKGVKQAKFEKLQITYVLPTTKKTFDMASFQKDNPNIDLSKYYKTSEVADSIRLTVF